MALNDKIREARKKLGYTQKKVAREVGISNTALSNYEKGYREPDLETIKRLAKFYQISMDTLLNFKLDEENQPLDIDEVTNNEKLLFQGEIYELNREEKQELRELFMNYFSKLYDDRYNNN